MARGKPGFRTTHIRWSPGPNNGSGQLWPRVPVLCKRASTRPWDGGEREKEEPRRSACRDGRMKRQLDPCGWHKTQNTKPHGRPALARLACAKKKYHTVHSRVSSGLEGSTGGKFWRKGRWTVRCSRAQNMCNRCGYNPVRGLALITYSHEVREGINMMGAKSGQEVRWPGGGWLSPGPFFRVVHIKLALESASTEDALRKHRGTKKGRLSMSRMGARAGDSGREGGERLSAHSICTAEIRCNHRRDSARASQTQVRGLWWNPLPPFLRLRRSARGGAACSIVKRTHQHFVSIPPTGRQAGRLLRKGSGSVSCPMMLPAERTLRGSGQYRPWPGELPCPEKKSGHVLLGLRLAQFIVCCLARRTRERVGLVLITLTLMNVGLRSFRC